MKRKKRKDGVSYRNKQREITTDSMDTKVIIENIK